jgi:hypothetical protein
VCWPFNVARPIKFSIYKKVAPDKVTGPKMFFFGVLTAVNTTIKVLGKEYAGLSLFKEEPRFLLYFKKNVSFPVWTNRNHNITA